jgi:hypothetical protein
MRVRFLNFMDLFEPCRFSGNMSGKGRYESFQVSHGRHFGKFAR